MSDDIDIRGPGPLDAVLRLAYQVAGKNGDIAWVLETKPRGGVQINVCPKGQKESTGIELDSTALAALMHALDEIRDRTELGTFEALK